MKPLSTPDPKEQASLMRTHAGTDLQNLVRLLTGRYQTARITCFAWIWSHRTREGCFTDHSDELFCHYFVVMETKEVYPEPAIQDYVNHHCSSFKVFIIAHHTGKIREALQSGHRFYTEVRNSGVVLYTSDSEPAESRLPEMPPPDADQYFGTHMELARSFHQAATLHLEHGRTRSGLFLLHQTVEQACIALIRVYLGYRADFHNLGRLLDLCSCFSSDPGNIFPRNNGEERRLFQILCRCYTEARYREDFHVETEDCRTILKKVTCFLQMTEELGLKYPASLLTGKREVNAPVPTD